MRTLSGVALRRVIAAFDDEQEARDAIALARALCAETGAELVAASSRDAEPARSYAALRARAEEERADLIVIAVQGSYPPAGTVRERVLNGAPCAVAVAPLGFSADAGGFSLRRIAVCHDGSRCAAAALAFAASMAARTAATLLLVGAVEADRRANGFDPDVVASHEEQRLRRQMERARAELDPRQAVEERVVRGRAAGALAEAAAGADLLAMGSRAQFGAEKRLFIGLLASALFRRAACPVLVAPAA